MPSGRPESGAQALRAVERALHRFPADAVELTVAVRGEGALSLHASHTGDELVWEPDGGARAELRSWLERVPDSGASLLLRARRNPGVFRVYRLATVEGEVELEPFEEGGRPDLGSFRARRYRSRRASGDRTGAAGAERSGEDEGGEGREATPGP